MLLLIDIGNTRIKWAVVDEAAALGSWHTFGAVAHARGSESDFFDAVEAWQQLPISRALVANVAGDEKRSMLQQRLPIPIDWFVSPPQAAGVRNDYREPTQLGCDRFAAAIGAHALFPASELLIVNCGTATTIDVVSADGNFSGGMILPGLHLMIESLARDTAQLPLVTISASSQKFADNTNDAITSGCVAAQIGAIEHAFAFQLASHATLRCIVSGGAAAEIAPQLSIPYTRVENLVLTGLHAYALSHAAGHVL